MLYVVWRLLMMSGYLVSIGFACYRSLLHKALYAEYNTDQFMFKIYVPSIYSDWHVRETYKESSLRVAQASLYA